MVPWIVPVARAVAPWIALGVLAAGCASGPAGRDAERASDRLTVRAADFRPAQVRQVVLFVHVAVAGAAEISERDRTELPGLYEGSLLETLDARAILVRDVRTAEPRGTVPDAATAAARAREVGTDHALVVSLRVEPDVVRLCEDTRRPLQGRATVWRTQARVVRAADGGERLRVETVVTDVEAECDAARPAPRRRGTAATTAAAVERLLGKVLEP
jgi:hypothetical protein